MEDASREKIPEMESSYVDAVNRYFDAEDAYWDSGTPTFIVKAKAEGDSVHRVKDDFKALAEELKPMGYLPWIRRTEDNYRLSILGREEREIGNTRWNVVLFAATLATVFLDGYIRSNNPVLTQALMSDTPVALNAAFFTFAIMAIFGVHELGHKAASQLRGVDASMPYFIPAPPGMGGTLGAVITQREPPVNRDALFDLGMSGPMAGFMVSILVGYLGMRLSYVVPMEQVSQWMTSYPEIRFQQIPMPIILDALTSWIKPTSAGSVLVMHPVAFAAWVGCILTFINLIPAWQLDGGHIVRSLVGKETHKIMSFAGVLLLVASGYFIMGIVVAFFLMREGPKSMEPLDDVSSLSLSRKLAFALYFLMIVLTFVAVIQL